MDAIPQFVRRAPDAKLIVQVSESDENNTVELYRRGVRGVVPRSIGNGLAVLMSMRACSLGTVPKSNSGRR